MKFSPWQHTQKVGNKVWGLCRKVNIMEFGLSMARPQQKGTIMTNMLDT